MQVDSISTFHSSMLWLLNKMLSIMYDRSIIHQIDGETLSQSESINLEHFLIILSIFIKANSFKHSSFLLK